MASSTRAVLRQRLAEAVGDYRALATTSSGSTTTVVDTELDDIVEGVDAIQGWIMMTSGSASGDIRRIKATGGYATGGTITLNFALRASSGNGSTYELYQRFWPTDLHDAINRAIEELFPILYLPIIDETLVVDDRLTNGGFESTIVAGAHPSWTKSGSPTVTTETTIVFHGSQAAKIVAGGSAGQMYQAPSINVAEMAGTTASFKAWVHTNAATQARVRLDFQTGDSSDILDGDYHTGDSSWRELSVSGSVPTDATEVRAICEVTANDTAYFDLARLKVGPLYRYTMPTTIIRGPHFVSQQYAASNVNGPYYPLSEGASPISDRIIRLEGIGLLSRPTTETGTTEVDGARVDLIVQKAKALLLEKLLFDLPENERAFYEREITRAERRVFELSVRPGVRMLPMSADIHRDLHFEEDASGRYLVFDRVRETIEALST